MNRYSSFKRPEWKPGMRNSSFRAPERGAKPKLARSWMKRRPTRVKAGSDKKYLAWLRTLPCANCWKPAPSEPSHERRKGTGLALKSADARAWPTCRPCHRKYERREGVFADETRQAWVDATCALLREVYFRSFGDEAELREKIAKGRVA